MSHRDEPVRILADRATAQRIAGAISRRQLLAAVGGSAALAAFLAACGSDSSTDSTSAPDTTAGADTSKHTIKACDA
mgnify:CR=1 FL=1